MKYPTLIMVIFLSSTLNAQWIQSSLNPGLGRSLFSDGTTIYAATNQGVYCTNDIGEPWFNIGPQNEDIFTVITVANKIIAGSGMGHGVFLSTDSGQNWYQPPTLSNHSIYTLAKNSSYIFAGSWGGGVFRSNDNGESWESVGLSGKGIMDLLAVENRLYVACPDGYSKIYYSSDNGNTWDYGSLGNPASDLRKLFYSDGKLFACDFGLWSSTDMGSNWHLDYGITFDSTGYPIDVMLFRSLTKYNQYLIASVAFESIYISSDNGASWIPFNDGLINDWTFVDLAINGSYIWSIRDFFGNAYRRPLTDIVTSAGENENSVNDFILLQNYPNPFNPKTIIKYAVPMFSNVSLKVYDILRNEIAAIINEEKSAGNYEVNFDGTDLSSGVYFYRLQAGTFTDTKKFILMK
ncbi:MAG: hypothetical protein A2V93_07575 [Ignavibacteria bacterium RBG_16_34_14]|nr:MAG: hypothetical protein A2V93_07575 [Ignavibacteria bacterium RBG_16_34_14]